VLWRASQREPPASNKDLNKLAGAGDGTGPPLVAAGIPLATPAAGIRARLANAPAPNKAEAFKKLLLGVLP